MRDAAAKLMARDRLGRDRFVRGVTEDVTRRKTVHYTANLLDLMQGYARIRTRDDFRPFVMDRDSVFTMEQALQRMRGLICRMAGPIAPKNDDPPRRQLSRPLWSWPRKGRSSYGRMKFSHPFR